MEISPIEASLFKYHDEAHVLFVIERAAEEAQWVPPELSILYAVQRQFWRVAERLVELHVELWPCLSFATAFDLPTVIQLALVWTGQPLAKLLTPARQHELLNIAALNGSSAAFSLLMELYDDSVLDSDAFRAFLCNTVLGSASMGGNPDIFTGVLGILRRPSHLGGSTAPLTLSKWLESAIAGCHSSLVHVILALGDSASIKAAPFSHPSSNAWIRLASCNPFARDNAAASADIARSVLALFSAHNAATEATREELMRMRAVLHKAVSALNAPLTRVMLDTLAAVSRDVASVAAQFLKDLAARRVSLSPPPPGSAVEAASRCILDMLLTAAAQSTLAGLKADVAVRARLARILYPDLIQAEAGDAQDDVYASAAFLTTSFELGSALTLPLPVLEFCVAMLLPAYTAGVLSEQNTTKIEYFFCIVACRGVAASHSFVSASVRACGTAASYVGDTDTCWSNFRENFSEPADFTAATGLNCSSRTLPLEAQPLCDWFPSAAPRVPDGRCSVCYCTGFDCEPHCVGLRSRDDVEDARILRRILAAAPTAEARAALVARLATTSYRSDLLSLHKPNTLGVLLEAGLDLTNVGADVCFALSASLRQGLPHVRARAGACWTVLRAHLQAAGPRVYAKMIARSEFYGFISPWSKMLELCADNLLAWVLGDADFCAMAVAKCDSLVDLHLNLLCRVRGTDASPVNAWAYPAETVRACARVVLDSLDAAMSGDAEAEAAVAGCFISDKYDDSSLIEVAVCDACSVPDSWPLVEVLLRAGVSCYTMGGESVLLRFLSLGKPVLVTGGDIIGPLRAILEAVRVSTERRQRFVSLL